MKAYTIVPSHVLQAEIEQSHQRSKAYGINLDVKVNENQGYLSPEGLKARRAKNELFFDLVNQQMKELYQLFAGQGFAIVVADHEGFIMNFHEIDRIRKLVNKMAGSLARFTFWDILGGEQGHRRGQSNFSASCEDQINGPDHG